MTYAASNTQKYSGVLAQALLRGNTDTSTDVLFADAAAAATVARRVRPETIRKNENCYIAIERGMDTRGDWRVQPLDLITVNGAPIQGKTALVRGNSFGKRTLIRLQVYKRLLDLELEAKNESIAISEASRADILAFLTSLFITQRPAIALLDNGNFRALWKNKRGEQIGLQFKGFGHVNYVIVRHDQNATIRDHGSTQVTQLPEILKNANVLRLVEHEG